jgi:hypothetical protein
MSRTNVSSRQIASRVDLINEISADALALLALLERWLHKRTSITTAKKHKKVDMGTYSGQETPAY